MMAIDAVASKGKNETTAKQGRQALRWERHEDGRDRMFGINHHEKSSFLKSWTWQETDLSGDTT